jgi:putative Mg2+ transporter-C (MgtC) family protein
MAAATFLVVSSQFVYLQHYSGSDLIEVDSSRIAASVVSGIGFLAGGAILRTGITIQGLTTAAGLWLVTAIGLCGGSGMFIEAVAVTVMGIGALTVLRRFEDKHVSRRRVSIVIEGGGGEEVAELAPIIASLRELSIAVSDLAYESEQLGNGGERVTATLAIETSGAVTVEKMIAKLRSSRGVRRVRVESP